MAVKTPNRRTRTGDDSADFWEKVDRHGPAECWPWAGPPDAQGRGRFSMPGSGGTHETFLAHRLAWEFHYKRDIPPQWECRQRCHNPLCCNPHHLYVVEPARRYLSDPAEANTIAAHIEQYLQYYTLMNYADKTVSTYARELGKLATWLSVHVPEVTSIEHVQRKHIQEFAFWLAQQPGEKGETVSRATRAKTMYAIRSMVKYFDSETDLEVMKVQAVKAPRGYGSSDRVPKSVATPEQVDQLITSCGDNSASGRRDQAIFALLFASGLRIHELFNLNRSLFPRERLGKEPTFKITVKGKGGHVRLIFLDQRAQATIRAMLDDREDSESALFVNFRPGRYVGKGHAFEPERLSMRGIQHMFRVRTERAGLAGLEITPHSLRHGLAIDLLEGGADIRTVQDVLGHQSIMTTQVYTRLTNKHLEEGYGKRKSLQPV